jgi:hypothetical protein
MTIDRERQYAALKNARAAFNAYVDQNVRPLLQLTHHEEDRLGLAGVAKRIGDLEVRREFVRLALSVLDANVDFYGSDATSMRQQIPLRTDRATPVVSALICAAIGYSTEGTVAALLGAAFGYWLGNIYAEPRAEEQAKISAAEAAEHNGEVPDWQQTLDEWIRAREALRTIEL